MKSSYVRRRANGTVSIQRESYGTFAEWGQQTAEIKKRDGGMCFRCRVRPGVEVHHIIPLSRGGTNAKSNKGLLCTICHDQCHRHSIPRGDSRQSTFKKKTALQKINSRIR